MSEQHWVFAYGSLMWNPGFAVAETVQARVEGFARRFCLRSVVYRGTVEAPGLVLGLDAHPGAHCVGLALRVAEPDWPETLAGLRERELTTDAYHEMLLPIRLQDGRQIEAITYVMQRDHDQYAGGLCATEQARIIATATGGRGPNRDYLYNTAAHLAELGLPDPEMEALAAEVRKLST